MPYRSVRPERSHRRRSGVACRSSSTVVLLRAMRARAAGSLPGRWHACGSTHWEVGAGEHRQRRVAEGTARGLPVVVLTAERQMPARPGPFLGAPRGCARPVPHRGGHRPRPSGPAHHQSRRSPPPGSSFPALRRSSRSDAPSGERDLAAVSGVVAVNLECVAGRHRDRCWKTGCASTSPGTPASAAMSSSSRASWTAGSWCPTLATVRASFPSRHFRRMAYPFHCQGTRS